jgi:hypothetical protein
MKKMFFLMVLAAVCSAAQAMLLDDMSDISGTGWVETRNSGLMLQETVISHDGNGSMKIDYANASGDLWDIVPQRYFHAGNPPVSPAPYNNQLDLTNPETNTVSLWLYKDEDSGRARINQIILFSYATSSPARYAVDENALVEGWNNIIAPASEFVVDGDDPAFLWSGIQTFQIWCTTWDTRGTSSIYIDDIQLIPEPATMSMLVLGGLLIVRRRKS